MLNLNKVLESNIIMLSSAELGLMITANGSYLQLWAIVGTDKFDCLNCRTFDYKKSLFYDFTTAKLLELSEEWMREIESNDDDDNDDDNGY